VIRRRRQCLACKRRFTTYERTGESFRLHVVKKDKTRVPYEREKIISGLQKACYKRPVSAEQIQQIADRTEEDIFRSFDKEVTSAFIGECVMKHLREVDKVAYIRFASVYRDFNDAGELIDEVSKAIQETEPADQLKLFEQ
jgi:transcriptional repressor NrdR